MPLNLVFRGYSHFVLVVVVGTLDIFEDVTYTLRAIFKTKSDVAFLMDGGTFFHSGSYLENRLF